MKLRVPEMEEPELMLAPLIDMTFLLLIYFLCTCSLIAPEADLGIRLPGMLTQALTVDMPDEQIIEIRAGGQIFLNGREFDVKSDSDLPELTATLKRYKLSSDAARAESLVTIAAEDDVRHQRVIDVMNACAAAKIKNVSFMTGSE